MEFDLFTQVLLREDIPKYGLKKGDIATIVEHYLMPEGEENGYSLEGFNVETITVEVAQSQIEPVKAFVSNVTEISEAEPQNFAFRLNLGARNP